MGFDPIQWPELDDFRDACLADDYATMRRIADKNHHWYAVENPDGQPMEKLARIFQAQHFASRNNHEALASLLKREPWVVNEPWTAQKWLPLSQAACAGADRKLIQLLLDHGANPCAVVGDPGEQGTIPEMARINKHPELASWLEEVARVHRANGE